VTAPNPSPQKIEILGTFASILGLLGIFLYFTGWIYRWAYFGWFQIELNRLDLPARSFLFVPIQVFFGNPSASLLTLFAIIIGTILIKFTLWLVQPLPAKSTLWSVQSVANNPHQFQYKLQQLLAIPRFFADIIPPALRKDLIVVIWLLIILFQLARHQGTIDARRDAVNETSTLPVITLVLPEKQIALGRNLDNLLLDPSLKGYRIIGSKELFNNLRGKENNDRGANPPRVWRLLLEHNKWTYVFPALSAQSQDDERPPILAINQDKEGQLMILAPVIPSIR
jgi:hypothetical protein